jgi:hypothetical protein
MDTNGSHVPSGAVIEKLSEYANILAKHGPDSPEARTFYEMNKDLPAFSVNARDLESLEREDRDWRL